MKKRRGRFRSAAANWTVNRQWGGRIHRPWERGRWTGGRRWCGGICGRRWGWMRATSGCCWESRWEGVIGGSQALARSLFAQITPQSRSGEFFSFFGFMSRASSVFGPMIYVVATALFDTRVAVTSILLIIIAGTVALRWVDVEEGMRAADSENVRVHDG